VSRLKNVDAVGRQIDKLLGVCREVRGDFMKRMDEQDAEIDKLRAQERRLADALLALHALARATNADGCVKPSDARAAAFVGKLAREAFIVETIDILVRDCEGHDPSLRTLVMVLCAEAIDPKEVPRCKVCSLLAIAPGSLDARGHCERCRKEVRT
jgi:hypothetical protein